MDKMADSIIVTDIVLSDVCYIAPTEAIVEWTSFCRPGCTVRVVPAVGS